MYDYLSCEAPNLVFVADAFQTIWHGRWLYFPRPQGIPTRQKATIPATIQLPACPGPLTNPRLRVLFRCLSLEVAFDIS